MSKKFKNLLLVILLLASFASMYFTINISNNDNNSISVNMGEGSPLDFQENLGSNNQNTPPEKPETEQSGSESDNQNTPPEKPDFTQNGIESNNQNTPPEMPNNENSDKENNTVQIVLLVAESLIAGTIIIYLVLSNFNSTNFKETFKNKNKIFIFIIGSLVLTGCFSLLSINLISNENSNSNNNINNNNMSSSSTNYSSNYEITKDEDITSGEYSSSTKDENVISVSGDVTSNLSNITVSKTGDSDGGDNTSFYGTNSAIIAKGGATLNIENATIETNATGSNGVFSYGGSATTNNSSSDGTTVNINNSKITTTKNNSGGIMTTGGGTMNANNLEITTSGVSSAAIRSDRGGGTVNVDGGTYTTNGQGSPSIYSTANITAKNAKLISNASEGVVIEGKNSVTLENVTLTDTNNKLNGQSTTYKNIFLYQSMSGDADDGVSTFTSKNSTITTNKGDTLYVTNTSAIINLENNTFINNDSTGNFLRIQKDSWGNSGSNGGNVTLNLTNQKVNGNIVVDSISTLDVNMVKSNYTGNINSDNTAKNLTINLDSSSTITLTSDSYVSSLINEDCTNSNINFNGYKLYVNGTAINQ